LHNLSVSRGHRALQAMCLTIASHTPTGVRSGGKKKVAKVGSGSSKLGTSGVWAGFAAASDVKGLTTKEAWTASVPHGATTILERWEAKSAEPPHTHPGDDMTGRFAAA
jgi:hypothetical protein